MNRHAALSHPRFLAVARRRLRPAYPSCSSQVQLLIEVLDAAWSYGVLCVGGATLLLLENLNIRRIIVHEVFQRKEDKKLVPPVYSDRIESLSTEATAQLRLRVTEALSAKAKSLEMQIARFDRDSHLALAAAMSTADDAEFQSLSRRIVDRLAQAQQHRSIPGGMLVIFDGQVGSPQQNFCAVIKAEIQSGFRRATVPNRAAVTEFLNNLFLTPATRLYKIGLFVNVDESATPPAGWKAIIFDANIGASHRESAAQYFFDAFLDCALPVDGAYETTRFFDLTKEFVRKSGLSIDDRRDVIDALYTFVKSEKTSTFTSAEFGEKYLPAQMRDDFAKYLDAHRFPSRAVVRDTSAMTTRLKRRRFQFGPEIEFSASPSAISEGLVTISPMPAAKLGGEGKDAWTQIVIKTSITDER